MDDILIEKHSVQDLFSELADIKASVGRCEAHAEKTNGRVTNLERVGIGMWVSQHPFKFAVSLVMISGMFISDIRHPVMELICGMFV